MPDAQTYTASKPGLNLCNGDKVYEEMNRTLSRCRSSFFKRAFLFLGNAADAEDAVQEALLSAYKHIDQYRGEAQMSTWLTAIVSNSARMQLRKRTRHIHVSLDEPVGEEEQTMSDQLPDARPTPEDECQNSELRERLTHLATQLSPSLRKAFQLRDLEGLSTREAANLLGVADGTVKVQLARARAKLRRLLRGRSRRRFQTRRTYTTSRTAEK